MRTTCHNKYKRKAEAMIISLHGGFHRKWLEYNGYKGIDISHAEIDFVFRYGWAMGQAIHYICKEECGYVPSDELYSRTISEHHMPDDKVFKFFPFPQINGVDRRMLEDIMKVHLAEDAFFQGITNRAAAEKHWMDSFAFIMYQAHQMYERTKNNNNYNPIAALRESLSKIDSEKYPGLNLQDWAVKPKLLDLLGLLR